MERSLTALLTMLVKAGANDRRKVRLDHGIDAAVKSAARLFDINHVMR